MSDVTLSVEVRIAWWFWPYLHALIFFCVLCRGEPDWEKLHRLTSRAVRIGVDRKGGWR